MRRRGVHSHSTASLCSGLAQLAACVCITEDATLHHWGERAAGRITSPRGWLASNQEVEPIYTAINEHPASAARKLSGCNLEGENETSIAVTRAGPTGTGWSQLELDATQRPARVVFVRPACVLSYCMIGLLEEEFVCVSSVDVRGREVEDFPETLVLNCV